MQTAQSGQTTQPASVPDSLAARFALTERHAWMLVAALMVGGIVALASATFGAHDRNDFAHYYLSATILLSGDDPYLVPLKPLCDQYGFEYDARIPYGANPPLLIRMFTCLAWLSPSVAFAIWATFQIVCLVAFLEATRRIVHWNATDVRFWLFVGLVLSSTSLQSHFVYSQVQLLVGAVIAAAYLARRNRRHLLACGLIALAAGFKIYPAVLLPWFVFSAASRRGDWLRRTAVVAVVTATVLAVVTGAATWISFIKNGLPVIHANTSVVSHTNYSIQAALVNGLGGLLPLVLPESGSHVAAIVARLAAPAIILAVYLLLYLRRMHLSDSAAFSVLVVTMILCSPVAWAHYLVLMIPPVAILFVASKRFADVRTRQVAYTAAALSLMPCLDASLFGISDHPLSWLVHYYPLYTLLIVAGLFLRLPGSFKFARPDGTARSP